MNTMADLRHEVASRLRNSLHGREIDMMESVKPRLPHMLGVTPLGKTHDPNNEKMSILDTSHPFWTEYEAEVRTKSKVTEKLETAIRSLREDDIFRITHPYGQEAEILYCEVDRMESTTNDMKTPCRECGERLTTRPTLSLNGRYYSLKVSLDCPSCDFSGSYKRQLHRE